MALFGKKQQEGSGLIGVDLGAGGIKAVEVQEVKNRARLLTYGYSVLEGSDVTRDQLLTDVPLGAEVLREVLKESGMQSKRINASLPSQDIFHAIITIPKPRDKSEVPELAKKQAAKLIPRPIDEMVLDTTLIDKDAFKKLHVDGKEKGKKVAEAMERIERSETADKHIQVLVSGAPKELVDRYVALFKAAKLELISLETEAFALIRSLIGKDRSRIMIVDIGYERTNITIVHESIPFLHRSIKAGGFDVTKTMMQFTGMGQKQAEQAKRDLASYKNNDIPKPIQEALQPILHEIRYSLQLYNQQDFHRFDTVEKIILTGGSAHLPYIDPFISKALNMNVYLGDPWARMQVPVGIRPILDDVGPKFSVAAGLAMKSSYGK